METTQVFAGDTPFTVAQHLPLFSHPIFKSVEGLSASDSAYGMLTGDFCFSYSKTTEPLIYMVGAQGLEPRTSCV